jgi:PsbP
VAGSCGSHVNHSNGLCTCTWQEVSVGGQDVVYKDIIEPLESVSVSITPSDKDDITLYGEPVDVSTLLGGPACIKRADAVHTFMLTNMP